MKNRFLLSILILATLISCKKDDGLTESRPVIRFNILLINNNFDVCRSLDITYIIDDEGVQTSYDVSNGSTREFDVNVRQGEFIGVTAFDTDDTSNTPLATANIDSQAFSETELNRLEVYYSECPVIDKIIWIIR